MKFIDQGLIISTKKYGENSAIIKTLTKENGLCCGFIKYSNSKKTRAIYQVGNLISFEYRSRVDSNLGSFFGVDLIKSYLANILFDKIKLDCLRVIFFIIDKIFLEGDNQPILFTKINDFLISLSFEDLSKKDIFAKYIKIELAILKILGYEIDLTMCVVTNSQLNLAFVSPKSARAVCYEAGLPYADKLLTLPLFLIDNNSKLSKKDLQNGLKLSGYFLAKYVFEQDERFIKIRSIIVDSLTNLKD